MNLKNLLNKNAFIFLILFLVGILVYGNVFGGSFLFDDNLLLENNVLIRSLQNFWQFFISNSQSGASVDGSNFYRPLQYLVYALNYKFFGLNVIPYHLVSIFLHIANAFLIFFLLQKINFSRVASFIAALFFVIHPVNTEAISYVSGVADPLGFFFLFCGLLQFLKLDRKRISTIILTFLFFILALLSKESTVIFFPLVLLLTLFKWQDIPKSKRSFQAQIIGGLFLLLVLYLVLKFTVFDFTGNMGLSGEKNIYTGSILVRFITFTSILWEYARLMILPLDMFLERPYTAYVEIFSLRFLFGFSILGLGLWASWFSFLRKKIFLLGFFWFFASLAPMSGIIPLNAMFLEHWLYFPLVGLLILLAGAWDASKGNSRKVLLSLLIIWGTFLTVRTVVRNFEWADPIKFYLNELQYSPRSARVRNNLAMEYVDLGKIDLAIEQYQKAIELRDDYPQTHHNLANIYFEQGDLPAAEKEYLKALKIAPNFIYSQMKLLELYKETDSEKYDEMIKELSR